MAISVGIGVLLVIGLAGVSATVRGLLHWSKTISIDPEAPRQKIQKGMPDAEDKDETHWYGRGEP